MVKTPRTRHSKTKRTPVTIDLDPGAVSRVADAPDASSTATGRESENMTQTSADEAVNAPRSENEKEELGSVEEITSSAETAASSSGFDDTASDKSSSAKADEPSGPTVTAPATPPARSRLPVFAAGIIGGIVTLAGAAALQFAGFLGSPANPTDPMPALGPIETEIAALKAEIATIKDTPGNAAGSDAARVEDLSQALEKVRTDVGSLQKAIESGKAGDTAGLEALGKRIDEIATQISGLSQDPGGATPADISAINERIASVEALAKAAGEPNSQIDGRLSALEQSFKSLSAKVEAQASQPKIALAIASAALKSAIERGVPFQSEIETFAAISPDTPEIEDLRKYAENGIATRAEILAETDAAANAMIAAAAPPKTDTGFFERLLASAESLVTVRPIGSVEGVGVPETVARMEVALQAGDFAQALAEYDSLPEAAREAAATFADKVRASLDVEQLVDKAVSSAMKAE